jgi:hypothetical protein
MPTLNYRAVSIYQSRLQFFVIHWQMSVSVHRDWPVYMHQVFETSDLDLQNCTVVSGKKIDVTF